MKKNMNFETLGTDTLTPVSFSELANILGGATDYEMLNRKKGQDSGHTGGLVCWC